MPLNASQCAKNIANSYLTAAGLSASGQPAGSIDTSGFPADFASHYNNYATQGVVLGATNSGGNAAIIENFMQGVSSSASTVTAFATALANFWAGVAVTPGAPAHGGVAVTSVTNNAASKISEFEAAILASYTTSESKPYFLNFISNIEAVVKSINYSITERLANGSSSVFIEQMS